jgi:hypothetical protein
MTETPNTSAPLDPETFNLDEWLVDAGLPKRSVDVYKRADLLAEMDELERQIQREEGAANIDDTLASGTGKLVRRYQELAQTFSRSALTITVRGLLTEEMSAIAEKAQKNKWPLHVTGIHMISKAIVSPEISLEGLYKLEKVIGSAQIGRIAAVVNEVSNTMPQVNASFLHRFSGQETGQE